MPDTVTFEIVAAVIALGGIIGLYVRLTNAITALETATAATGQELRSDIKSVSERLTKANDCLTEIKTNLARGDQRMQALEDRVAKLEAATKK